MPYRRATINILPQMIGVLLLVMLMRAPAIGWGLPYIIDGDEFRVINNGLSVYYLGQQNNDPAVAMGNYPPLRSWEIAATRLILLRDTPINAPGQIFWGRSFSLFYAILSAAILCRLTHALTRKPQAGLLAAGFFALWPDALWYGHVTLVDGAALMFFLATLWASLNAHRRCSLNGLTAALILGLCAALAKYNFGLVLLVPVTLAAIESTRRPRMVMMQVVVPTLLIALPILAGAYRTLNTDNLVYDYLRPDAQLAYQDFAASLRELQPRDQQIYENTPRSIPARWAANFDLMLGFLSPLVMVVGLNGATIVILRQPANGGTHLFLILLGTASFLLIGSRIATGARQLFPTMIVLVILAAYAITLPTGRLRVPLLALAVIFLAYQGIESWQSVQDFRRTDSRAATADWFIDHAPDGSRILSQTELYEFGVLNGFASEKRFVVTLGDDLYTDCPDYFVVEDEGRLPPLAHRFWADIEAVARFAPPDFSGPLRIIFGVRDSCDLEDTEFLVN